MNATVLKTSAGAALSLPIARVTNLAEAIRDLKKKDDVPIPAGFETAESDGDGRWWRSWFIRKTPLTEALSRAWRSGPIRA